MAKKFYLVTSFHESLGYEVIGLFDNKEQAEAAATLEEIEFKDDADYNEWIDFYTTVTKVEMNTKDYKTLLQDYRKKEEEARQVALQNEMRKDSEYIKYLIETYKQNYGEDPQL